MKLDLPKRHNDEKFENYCDIKRKELSIKKDKTNAQLIKMKGGLKKAFERKLLLVRINSLQERGLDASQYIKMLDQAPKTQVKPVKVESLPNQVIDCVETSVSILKKADTKAVRQNKAIRNSIN